MAEQYAKALYAFQGEEENDLSFNEDEILRIIRQDESGWWEGQTDDGRRGDFPYNYVELIAAADLDRVRTASNIVGNTAKSANDTVKKVSVDAEPNSTKFKVEVNTTRKSFSAVKNVEDFRVLDEQLRFLYPNFDRPLPPAWADKVYESEQASKKKASILEIYLRKLIGSRVEETEFTLVSWVDPRQSFTCSKEAKSKVTEAQRSAARTGPNSYNASLANAFPIARAKYPWNANDAVELPLQLGTLIAVRNKKTDNDGWWEGETSDGQRGIFPSNYIDMLSDSEKSAVISGQKAQQAQPAPAPFTSPTQPTQLQPKQSAKAAQRQRKTENNFAMPSLDAFDELLLEGYTMLSNNRLFTPKSGAQCPKQGDTVQIGYTAFVWDCQKQRIIEFESSDLPNQQGYVGPLQFTVGKGETIKALEKAVQSLEVGNSARIVVRPDMGFGEVGSPPNVPPNCHLVYDVVLDTYSGASAPVANASGHGRVQSSMGGMVRDRAKRPHNPRNNQTQAYDDAGSNGKKYTLEQMRHIVETSGYVQYGVNMSFLEDQLTDEAFEQAFQHSRADFMLMPRWKRSKLKEDAGIKPKEEAY